MRTGNGDGSTVVRFSSREQHSYDSSSSVKSATRHTVRVLLTIKNRFWLERKGQLTMFEIHRYTTTTLLLSHSGRNVIKTTYIISIVSKLKNGRPIFSAATSRHFSSYFSYLRVLENVFSDGLQVGDVWDVADVVGHSLDYNITGWEHKLVGTHLRRDSTPSSHQVKHSSRK